MYKKNKNLKRLGMTAVISIIALTFAAQASAVYDPEISVCTPDWTITAFDATIRMEYFDGGVRSLEGQFDLSFDTDVVELKSVTSTEIDCKDVTIKWDFVDGSDNSKIRIEFTVPDDVNSMLTNGNIAKVHFDLVGDRGDSSLLDISGGSLAYKDGTAVSAEWTDETVNIGSFDVIVNAPESITTDTFDADISITDVVDLDSMCLVLSFDPGVVNVTDVKPGKISGKEIPIEMWSFDSNNTIKVISNLPIIGGVSGSGTLMTITFAVIGEDGDSSVLDIVEKSPDTIIVNAEGDKLPINWIDATVTITSEAPPPPSETDTTVYVKNLDDDKLTVFLFIDSNFIIDKDVLSGSTKKYSSYKLLEGSHTFKIRWYDLDTEEWHEKIEDHSVSGEHDVVVINTVKHADEGAGSSTHVYVKNLDDDRLDAYLYIDESFKDFEDRIPSGYTEEFGRSDGYKLTEGNHTFRVEWYDPDTGEEHQTIKECLITGYGASVTIYIEKHDNINTHVYVMNLDDDDPDVYLYIDEFFKDFADRVSPGYTREFGESDGYKLTEGNHTFRIEWYDPDTGEEHQTTRECLITRDVAITLYTERHDCKGDITVNITVNAPEVVSETFEVTIDVTDVTDLCGAQFELTFDPDVIDVGRVEPGMIDDREMPIMYRMIGDGRLMIMIFDFDLIVEGGVSGPGYLAKITFDVVGDAEDTSAIDFCESDAFMRKLVDVDGEMIDANWSGADVTIGTTTSIETSSLELSSSPPTVTAGAQEEEARGTPAAAVSDAPSEGDEPQDIITAHNFLSAYALIGCSSHPYTWWLTE